MLIALHEFRLQCQSMFLVEKSFWMDWLEEAEGTDTLLAVLELAMDQCPAVEIVHVYVDHYINLFEEEKVVSKSHL